MRAAIERSLAVHQARTVYYDRGSIVICTSCGRPLYRLERGIELGEKAGRCVSAFAPVSVADLETLLERRDVDAGVRAQIRAIESLADYTSRIVPPRTGMPMLCPFCDQVFMQGRTVEQADTIDRAFVLEPVVIPPRGAAVGLSRMGRDPWRIV